MARQPTPPQSLLYARGTLDHGRDGSHDVLQAPHSILKRVSLRVRKQESEKHKEKIRQVFSLTRIFYFQHLFVDEPIAALL